MKQLIPNKYKLSLTLFASFLANASAFADDAVGQLQASSNDIIIDRGTLVTNNIGIADFSYQGVNLAPGTIEKIIANDLKVTAKFNPLIGNKLPENVAEGVHPQVWVNADVYYLVSGQVTAMGQNIKIDYSLFDMTGGMCDIGRACVSKSYVLPASEVRQLAHLVSSNIFKKFTKVEGGFTTKIAYVQQPIASVEKYNLVVSDWDGANAQVVYSSNKPILSPSFSQDGNNIVFTNYTTFASVIKNYNLTTGKTTTLVTDQGNNGAPAYSPDGKYLAYSHGNKGSFDIYLMNLSNGQKTNLTHGIGRNTEPSWYGNTIIFTSDRSGNPSIYQMQGNGANPTKVSRTSGQTTDAEVAPTGKYLVMINNNRVVAQDVKSGSVQNITNTFLDQDVTVSSNGFNAIYSATVGNKSRLFLTSLDGQFYVELPALAGVLTNPTWQKHTKLVSE